MRVKIDDTAVKQALSIAPKEMTKSLETIIHRTALRVQREFTKNINKGQTGFARNNIAIERPNRLTATIYPRARYADFLETGTRPHWTSIQNIEGYARFRGLNPYALQRSIARKGTKAHPFLDKTYRKARNDFINEVNEQAQKTIDRNI